MVFIEDYQNPKPFSCSYFRSEVIGTGSGHFIGRPRVYSALGFCFYLENGKPDLHGVSIFENYNKNYIEHIFSIFLVLPKLISTSCQLWSIYFTIYRQPKKPNKCRFKQ